jgi:hypothetical protein
LTYSAAIAVMMIQGVRTPITATTVAPVAATTATEGAPAAATTATEGGTSSGDEGGGGGCFVAGTPVRTGVGGWRPIEEIALEANLVSCDVDTGAVAAGTVTRLFKTTSPEIVTIRFDDETLRCTPRHRFFTTSGWMAAGRLSPGIEVRCLGGRMREIVGVSVEPAETPVFNMRVDRHHTYFVGETGYLVHNEKDQDPDGGALGDDIPGNIDEKKRSPPTPKPTPKPKPKA